MSVLAFTICSNNYLAQAITLGQSLHVTNPQIEFKIVLVDRKTHEIDYALIPYEVIEVECMNIPSFNKMVLQYSIVELNTAIKPFAFQYLFSNYSNCESLIYLDPDILVFSCFTVLEEELKVSNIVLTPHMITPIPLDNRKPQEEDILNSGVYNLGFLAVKRSKTATDFLRWWAERLYEKAYIDFLHGLFTDQIWINLVPLYYDGVAIMKDIGYNVAYWNFHERLIKKIGDEFHVISNAKKNQLVFFHFSGYSPLYGNVISKYQNRFSFEEREDLIELFGVYKNKLLKNGHEKYVGLKCFYVEYRNNIIEKKSKDKNNEMSVFRRLMCKLSRKLYRKYNM